MQITDITPVKPKSTKKIRLAAYARVSTKSEEQIHSFLAQIRYYNQFVKEHPEYELLEVYTDEGITGTEMEKRDGLNRLLADCKAGKIDRIITKSVSRFARNTEELLAMVRFLKDIGVSVYFEKQGIDTEQLNAEMIVTLPGLAAQKESDAISANVRWGIRKRMELGEFVGGIPYGYKSVNGQLEINETEAEIVRRIFRDYLSGMGIYKIKDSLNEDLIPRRKKGVLWTRESVRYILTNSRYKGDALFLKQYITETLPHRQVRNKGEQPMYFVENSNVAIIDRNDFDKVQKLFQKKKIEDKKKRASVFARKIICADCGGSFHNHNVRDKTYWVCWRVENKETNCVSRRVREDMVKDCFVNMVYKLKYNKQILTDAIETIETIENTAGIEQEEIRKIDKEIADLSAKNLVITRLHTSGIMSATDFSIQNSAISNRITKLRSDRKKKLAEAENDEINILKELDETITDYAPNGKFDEDLFENIVEKVIPQSNKVLQFRLIGGVELVETIKEKGRCGSNEMS